MNSVSPNRKRKISLPLVGVHGIMLLLFLSALSGSTNAQDRSIFRHEVDTDKKPWTGTHFYNDPDNFQFLLVSDRSGGTRPGVFKTAVEKINLLYPEFVLSVGDLIEGYTKDTAQIKKEWAEVNGMIDELKMPFFYLPGNHDITNQVMAEEWEKRYGKRYYYFTYRKALFIILDSNDDDDHNLTREQTDYVLNTISAHAGARWTFVLMHHPIWKYDTGGRFQEIEQALAGKKHTIIAGHEHHYHHEAKQHANYYILATTGGGSRLRGKYFGEFDHVTWITMTDGGPVLANLALDGIIPHDISNEETRAMARAMLDNTAFSHLMLCNTGKAFTDGTLYFRFYNQAEYPLQIDLNFYHQHQLNIGHPKTSLSVEPGKEHIVEIPFSADHPVAYETVEALQIDWTMQYEAEKFPGFKLSGNYDLEVKPTETHFINPLIPKFIDEITVSAVHPFDQLKTILAFDGSSTAAPNQPLRLSKPGTVSLLIENAKDQRTAVETVHFEKTELVQARRVKRPKDGLRYTYYEGNWDRIPDFESLKPISRGVVQDLLVGDIARRKDHFGVAYTGFYYAPESGMYVFRTRADDACRFMIGDQLVVNQDLDTDNGFATGYVALEKGYHPVTIYFVERSGNERLRLYKRTSHQESWDFIDVQGNFYH